MEIEYATIGGARLAIANNGNRDNNASTLVASYVDDSKVVNVSTSTDYVEELMWSGIPLSITLCSDAINPSASGNLNFYYAINIIENNETEDAINPSFDVTDIPYDPSDRTFTLNGNRLSASKKANRYYFNIINTGETPISANPVTFMGLPLAQGTLNELIFYKTSYAFSDVEELLDIMIGGSPLTVGRRGNNYYLIVSPIVTP